jgi:hypothetical protein
LTGQQHSLYGVFGSFVYARGIAVETSKTSLEHRAGKAGLRTTVRNHQAENAESSITPSAPERA